MACKSMIYTVNNTPTAIALNGTLPLGATNRRFGCNLMQNGDGISVQGGQQGSGYYRISATVTAVPDAAGTVAVTVYRDGTAIPGATASATVAATDTAVTLPIMGDFRLGNCSTGAVITMVLTGAAATVNRTALMIEKQ